MKRKTNTHLRLNKINVSKLNALNANIVLGGALPYSGEKETCDLDHCTSSRTGVDFGDNRSNDTNC